MAFCLNMDRKSKENIVNKVIRVLTLQNGLTPWQIRAFTGINSYECQKAISSISKHIVRKDKKIFYYPNMINEGCDIKKNDIVLDGYIFRKRYNGQYTAKINGKYTLMHRYILRNEVSSRQDIVKSYDGFYHHVEPEKYYIVRISSLYRLAFGQKANTRQG